MNHRDDFTPSDLPEGYRALLMGEQRQIGDECYSAQRDEWFPITDAYAMVHVSSAHHKHRTRRGITEVKKCPACGQLLPH